MESYYYEDLEIGMVFDSPSVTVGEEDSIRFAREFDPQPFHIDHEAGRHSAFGRLVTSGWHTAALTMQLKTKTELAKVHGGMIGLGLEQVRWPQSVYPGDTLRARYTIVEKRPSGSQPTHGIVKYRVETFNQDDGLVMEMLTSIWVPRRNVPKQD